MSDRKNKQAQTNNSSLSAGATAPSTSYAAEAVATIHNFTTFFPPSEVRENLWQLLAGSMSGPHADGWTALERSNLLLFYRLTGELADAVHYLFPKNGSGNGS